MTMTRAPNSTEILLDELDRKTQSYQKTLDQFIQDMQRNPSLTLAWWGEQAMLAAAGIEHLNYIRTIARYAQDGMPPSGEHLPGDTPESILERMDHSFLNTVHAGARISGSTGACHRAMALARAELGLQWFDPRESLPISLRKRMERTLTQCFAGETAPTAD